MIIELAVDLMGTSLTNFVKLVLLYFSVLPLWTSQKCMSSSVFPSVLWSARGNNWQSKYLKFAHPTLQFHRACSSKMFEYHMEGFFFNFFFYLYLGHKVSIKLNMSRWSICSSCYYVKRKHPETLSSQVLLCFSLGTVCIVFCVLIKC